MKLHNTIVSILLTASFGALAVAQAPVPSVDPQHHGNLAAAQQSILQAYGHIGEAQHENGSHLAGHAQKAKELLIQANNEIQAAADVADRNDETQNAAPVAPAPAAAPVAESAPPAIANIAGNWTIYAYNTGQAGSSLKQVQLNQNGNIISGEFHGPHQHGKLQGWINGNHVEFSTDTLDVLTFRGEVTATGMSGLYGFHGEHAPWNAERTN